jgi:flagellar motility protein MotE (MotC chaperone)
MIKTLEKLIKIKELERLIELQKLENLKYELKLLEEKKAKYFQLLEEKIKNVSSARGLREVALLSQGIRVLEKRQREKNEDLQRQENKVKELNLEHKILSTYLERKREEMTKEELKREERERSYEHLLKRSYGKFLPILLFFFLLPLTAGAEEKALPYQEKLIKPYLQKLNEEFEKLSEELLKSFRALEKKQKQLEEKEKFILQKEEELKKLLNTAINLEKQERERQNEKVKKLLQIIAKADPDSAGEALSQVNPQIAGEVLIKLPNTRKAGEILSSMEPDKAGKVIEYLMEKKNNLAATPIRKKIEEILRYVEGESI